MLKNLVVTTSIFLFALVFFVNPAEAKGNPHNGDNSHGNSHQTIVLDEPDEGDNQHPSGKDRSVEPGKSGTQGKSDSDPDDDSRGPDRSNGGPDKQPDGAGGVDRGDQDNNNGCGNDDDFEDDNEGWCGRKPKDDPNGGNGNGDGNGGKEDGNGGNGEPTPKQPKVRPEGGEVLGAANLPETGSGGNGKDNISFALSLLLGGVVLRAVNKRLSLEKTK